VGGGRGRGDDCGGQVEIVRLHDHGVPVALLFVAYGVAGCAKPVYVTTH
jgi:hypothetical protein